MVRRRWPMRWRGSGAETLTLSDRALAGDDCQGRQRPRGLLAGFNQDHVPILDADAAYADERMRWQAGTDELHSTMTQLCDVFGILGSAPGAARLVAESSRHRRLARVPCATCRPRRAEGGGLGPQAPVDICAEGLRAGARDTGRGGACSGTAGVAVGLSPHLVRRRRGARATLQARAPKPTTRGR